MNIKSIIKSIPGTTRIYIVILGIPQLIRTFRLLRFYIKENKVRKLHIGCGPNILIGWLNSDYYPRNKKVIHLDASRKFPIQDETFDFIFSEHMIEHIPLGSGVKMLNECYRILKPGGKIRISTPDMKFLIDLYSTNKNDLQEDYIKWSFNSFIKSTICNDTIIINNFVRDWGHKFIYDFKTLSLILANIGYKNITRYQINESKENAFIGIENISRMPEGFLQLESFVVEASKV
jgi:predicted SAM-dependent methyltransferase